MQQGLVAPAARWIAGGAAGPRRVVESTVFEGAPPRSQRAPAAVEVVEAPRSQRAAAAVEGVEALHSKGAAAAVEVHRDWTEGQAPRTLTLLEVERVLSRAEWLVDACRRELRCGARQVSFARKPVLFELLCCLAECWPRAATREQLIVRGFGVRRSNDSHRARLRVELGRLRRLLAGLGAVQADGPGYRLVAAVSGGSGVELLLPRVDGQRAAVLALLGDGVRWSSSALALALGASQRSLQRALLGLQQTGRVCGHGQGRARRWSAPPQWALEPQLFGLLAL